MVNPKANARTFKDLAEAINDHYSGISGKSRDCKKVKVPPIILQNLDTIAQAIGINKDILGNNSEKIFNSIVRRGRMHQDTRQSYFAVVSAYAHIQTRLKDRLGVTINADKLPHFAILCENAYNMSN